MTNSPEISWQGRDGKVEEVEAIGSRAKDPGFDPHQS